MFYLIALTCYIKDLFAIFLILKEVCSKLIHILIHLKRFLTLYMISIILFVLK